MQLITCAGYYGTGSSAVTDLLSEYDSIINFGSNFECRIAHDMWGLSDLEYYLVETNHRHNASQAIKNFMRLMEIYGLNRKIRMENYPYYFNNFKECVDEYLNKIIGVKFEGGSHVDLYNKSNLYIIWLKIRMRINSFLNRSNKKQSILDSSFLKKKQTPYVKELKKQTTYMSFCYEDFCTVTRDFTSKLFSVKNLKEDEILYVDQLVPVTNIMRYMRYFEDLKVVCVNRDPRDLYILEKLYWKVNVIPSKIDEFIKWYKISRAHLSYEKDDEAKVLRINFEDMIYDYDNIVKKIEVFYKIDGKDHTKPRTAFDPDISVNNTRLWEKHSELKNDIEKIEKELSLYLYNYKSGNEEK